MSIQALATSNAGMAFALGLREGGGRREPVLKHCRDIVACNRSAGSADLRTALGDDPDIVAVTVQVAP